MATPGHIEQLKKGRAAWEHWYQHRFQRTPDGVLDFSGHVFEGDTDFSGIEFFCAVSFENAEFRGDVDFANCHFKEALLFSGAIFSESVDFSNAHFSSEANFRSVHFQKKANFFNALFEGSFSFEQAGSSGRAIFRKARFLCSARKRKNEVFWCTFSRAVFENVDFGEIETRPDSKLVFERALLPGADFQFSSLSNSNFQNARLDGADFRSSYIEDTNFTDAILNTETRFDGAKVRGVSIGKYGLVCLKDYGGLTVGDRMEMDIRDDVSLMRSSYSGFQQWLHISGLIGFLFPYTWFLGVQWSRAKFPLLGGDSEERITLLEALTRFIWNAGEGWQVGYQFHWTFLLFLIALVFNSLRFTLLAKTKSLELQQTITGLPVAFSLTQKVWNSLPITWNHLYQTSVWGLYFYTLVVLVNLYRFFGMSVPVQGS